MSRQRGTILIYGLIALALVGALSAIAWSIYRAGQASKQVEWDRAAAQQARNEAAQAHRAAANLEENNAEASVIYKTITRSVDRYVDRPVYRAECFDADGLRDANAALTGQAARPAKPDYSLSGSDAARGRHGSIGLAQTD